MGSFIGVCFQKDRTKKTATQGNITEVGIAVKVTTEFIDSGPIIDSTKVISGVSLRRFRIRKYNITLPPFNADVDLYNDDLSLDRENNLHNDGIVKKLKELAFRYVDLITESDIKAKSRTDYIRNETNIIKLHYTIAEYLKISDEEKYQLIEIDELEARIEKLLIMIQDQIRILEAKGELKQKARENIQREVRKQYLKKHLQEINKEIWSGEKDELSHLEEKIHDAKLPEEVHEKAMQELNRLRQMGARDPDYNVQKKYLDTLVELPWSKSSEEINDINHAEKIMNKDHAGLEKVKKRILEFLAVKILKKDSKGSILCLQGPPGVGKTSLGKSIAQALGRKFERVALGGVKDEAEIRGHRRTYVGAMPGVFIEALLKCKTNNPVILLDEIDKIARNSYQGDPSSALLELLDPNQNNSFRDHYLGMPFDLSNVLFISTANTLETIQGPLLDRMEIISLAGYTLYEKTEIAMNYLVPKQIHENGLKPNYIEFQVPDVHYIISHYTREAGVRTLERTIGAICRKVAFDFLKHQQPAKEKSRKEEFKPVKVNEKYIEEVLGPRIFEEDFHEQIDQPGIVVGMAWTQVGGKIMLVETSRADGRGKLEITGQLGDVMKESVSTALGWIRANKHLINLIMTYAYEKNILEEEPLNDFKLEDHDINIHFPAASIPKDGPSAGIAITVALVMIEVIF